MYLYTLFQTEFLDSTYHCIVARDTGRANNRISQLLEDYLQFFRETRQINYLAYLYLAVKNAHMKKGKGLTFPY